MNGGQRAQLWGNPKLDSATGQNRAEQSSGPLHKQKCSLPGKSSILAEERDENKFKKKWKVGEGIAHA